MAGINIWCLRAWDTTKSWVCVLPNGWLHHSAAWQWCSIDVRSRKWESMEGEWRRKGWRRTEGEGRRRKGEEWHRVTHVEQYNDIQFKRGPLDSVSTRAWRSMMFSVMDRWRWRWRKLEVGGGWEERFLFFLFLFTHSIAFLCWSFYRCLYRLCVT